MLTYRDTLLALRKLGLGKKPVIVHASLRTVGPLRGGAEALIAALLESAGGLIAPTFTYQTMVTPLNGPPLNGIRYGAYRDQDLMAEMFRPNLPPHKMMGILPRVLLRHAAARRTRHPLLSFGGIHTDEILAAQTLYTPLAPIAALAERGGWALLIGVTQTSNTSLHYAEKLAGRRQFTRWALTPHGIREIPGFPGCSLGFDALLTQTALPVRRIQLGQAEVTAWRLPDLLEAARDVLQANPRALLCRQSSCLRCRDVRRSPFDVSL